MQKIKSIFLLVIISLTLFSCEKNQKTLVRIEGKTIVIDNKLSSNASIEKTINPYQQKMVNEINKVISFAPKNLVRTDGEMQSSLGNLLADLCFEKGDSIFYSKTGNHADFSFFNYGGIRAGINQGNVTNKNVFELMPFENTLVVVEMSKQKVEELIVYFRKNKTAHPISKQVEFILNGSNYLLKINNQPLDKNKTYKVVTSNYLQSGGDKMYFFENPISLFESNYLIRDAIKSHFNSKDTLVSKLDNRVIIK